MFEILVYYHDVLRYTIYATSEKAQELRGLGFYVEMRPIPLKKQFVPDGKQDMEGSVSWVA